MPMQGGRDDESPGAAASSDSANKREPGPTAAEINKWIKAAEEKDKMERIDNLFPLGVDIQTCLVAIILDPDASIWGVMLAWSLLLLFFATRVSVFALIGVGNVCALLVDDEDEDNIGRRLSGEDTIRSASVIWFCLFVASLRLAPAIANDADMAIQNQKVLLKAIDSQDRDQTSDQSESSSSLRKWIRSFPSRLRRFLFISTQTITIARRFCIPIFATVASIQTIVNTDYTKDNYGETFADPTTLLLDILAILFVLEIDTELCGLFFCADKVQSFKKISHAYEAQNGEDSEKVEQPETNAKVKHVRFDGEEAEVNVYGLNLLNRLTVLVCTGVFLAGYYTSGGSEPGGLTATYFEWFTLPWEILYSPERFLDIIHGDLNSTEILNYYENSDYRAMGMYRDFDDPSGNETSYLQTKLRKDHAKEFCDVHWGSAWIGGLIGLIVLLLAYVILLVIWSRNRPELHISFHLWTMLSAFALGYGFFNLTSWIGIGECRDYSPVAIPQHVLVPALFAFSFASAGCAFAIKQNILTAAQTCGTLVVGMGTGIGFGFTLRFLFPELGWYNASMQYDKSAALFVLCLYFTFVASFFVAAILVCGITAMIKSKCKFCKGTGGTDTDVCAHKDEGPDHRGGADGEMANDDEEAVTEHEPKSNLD